MHISKFMWNLQLIEHFPHLTLAQPCIPNLFPEMLTGSETNRLKFYLLSSVQSVSDKSADDLETSLRVVREGRIKLLFTASAWTNYRIGLFQLELLWIKTDTLMLFQRNWKQKKHISLVRSSFIELLKVILL